MRPVPENSHPTYRPSVLPTWMASHGTGLAPSVGSDLRTWSKSRSSLWVKVPPSLLALPPPRLIHHTSACPPGTAKPVSARLSCWVSVIGLLEWLAMVSQCSSGPRPGDARQIDRSSIGGSALVNLSASCAREASSEPP